MIALMRQMSFLPKHMVRVEFLSTDVGTHTGDQSEPRQCTCESNMG